MFIESSSFPRRIRLHIDMVSLFRNHYVTLLMHPFIAANSGSASQSFCKRPLAQASGLMRVTVAVYYTVSTAVFR